MTAKQIMKFANEHAYDGNMFYEAELSLTEEKYEILIKLESDPYNKGLNRKFRDILEKFEMIQILRTQRLELMRQAKI